MAHKRGFTLIEFMIALGGLCIVIMLTITNFSFLNDTLLHHEVEKLYAACMHAQRIAMASSQDQTMQFDLGAHTYSFNGRVEKLPKNINFGYIIGAKGPPSAPQNTIIKPITFKNQSIVFSPKGIISAGTVYVTDSNKKCMYALSSSISQVSFLRKYRYDTKWGLI